MGELFRVSVITPVYNAAEFVTRAVESALAQPETDEVLLIEDGSPDNSLEVCQALATKYEKVKLLRHPDGENRGAGASRNLGMKNASSEYIGFVDADNFYQPSRFTKTSQVFSANPDCEGVYESIGIHVEDESSLKRWIASGRHPVDKLITLAQPVPPDKLGQALISGRYGSLTLDGLVLKREVIQRTGYMAEHLRLHQDTEFILRCAIAGRLYPGELDQAVAMEGVHTKNRFSAPRSVKQEFNNKMAYWLSLYHWAKLNTDQNTQLEILKSMISFMRGHKYYKNFPRDRFPTRLVWLTRLLKLIRYPELIIDLLKAPGAKR